MTPGLNESVWSVLVLALFMLTVVLAVRAYSEMHQRGIDTLPWVLGFLLTGPVALAVYYLARPRTARV